jgi:hypothetical protein
MLASGISAGRNTLGCFNTAVSNRIFVSTREANTTYRLTFFQEWRSTAIRKKRTEVSPLIHVGRSACQSCQSRHFLARFPSERSFLKAHLLQQTPPASRTLFKAALSFLLCHFSLTPSRTLRQARPKQCKSLTIRSSSSFLLFPFFHHLSPRPPSSGAPQPSLTHFPSAAQHRVSSNSPLVTHTSRTLFAQLVSSSSSSPSSSSQLSLRIDTCSSIPSSFITVTPLSSAPRSQDQQVLYSLCAPQRSHICSLPFFSKHLPSPPAFSITTLLLHHLSSSLLSFFITPLHYFLLQHYLLPSTSSITNLLPPSSLSSTSSSTLNLPE